MSGSFAAIGAEWLNEPEWRVDGDVLEMHAAEGSDLWQLTSYGFSRDTGHALLHPLESGRACEVDVLADMSEQFDQAGLLVRVDETLWLKIGLELADGSLGASTVFTDGRSDWSTSPVDDWVGAWVRFRVSRGPDSLTVRARPEGGEWRLVRLVPFTPSGPVRVGPYCASPSRAGYVARFRALSDGRADSALHPEDD
jgi:regulation of enolase protein 1 (concanavalin A-like superfamily)